MKQGALDGFECITANSQSLWVVLFFWMLSLDEAAEFILHSQDKNNLFLIYKFHYTASSLFYTVVALDITHSF